MKAFNILKTVFLKSADMIYGALPQPQPDRRRLNQIKVIAHRGAWNAEIRENTIKAFDRALDAGAWAMEFDIRWSKDEVPVVHHDLDAMRVFGNPLEINQSQFTEIRERLPEIPSLKEVIDRYGGRIHLMIEIKPDDQGLTPSRLETLSGLLKKLEPVRDFHFMSLRSNLLERCTFVPSQALLPVSEISAVKFSSLALEKNWAGISSQYALIRQATIDKHLAQGQVVGTGFVESRSVLYREINRGVNWIFTNHAIEIGSILRDLHKE